MSRGADARLCVAAAAGAVGGMALLAALRPRLAGRCRMLAASAPRPAASLSALPPGARVPPPAAPAPVPAAPVRVALCQLAVSADKAANQEAARSAVRDAAAAGAQLVVLPEMWNCPYGAPWRGRSGRFASRRLRSAAHMR
jgi:omega-amidase